MRSFIAAQIPEGGLNYDISCVKKYARASLVKPVNRHITLFFLGDISEEDAKVAEFCMKSIPAEKFRIEMTGIDVFRQGAVYIECRCPALESYRVRLGNLLKAEFVPFNDNKFRMHITLARIREVKDRSGLNNFIKSLQSSFQTSHFNVESIVLYKSQLSQSGPVYSELYRAGC